MWCPESVYLRADASCSDVQVGFDEWSELPGDWCNNKFFAYSHSTSSDSAGVGILDICVGTTKHFHTFAQPRQALLPTL